MPSPRFSLAVVVAISLAAGCQHQPSAATADGEILANHTLAPSPRLLVGRVIAIDLAQGFAFVELASDAPAEACSDGTELIARTSDLRTTARLRASRQLRGRTLGADILTGQPTPGDEVVWLAP